MGGGASRPRGTLGSARSPPVDTARSDPGGSTKSLTGVGATPPPAVGGPVIASRRESNKLPTGIDARIIATLRQLNLARRAKPTPKGLNFERIVLKFSLARDAFNTMHAIYDQFANVSRLLLFIVGRIDVADIVHSFVRSCPCSRTRAD